MEQIQTKYIILRRTPYQESSLIAAGISPDFGRLDFLLKGARGTGPKKFPHADLFRELSIAFRPKANSALNTARASELLRNFDGIALRTRNYLEACSSAAYLLKHLPGGIPCPETFRATEVFLERLSTKDSPEMASMLLHLAFAYESGIVPEPGGERERHLLSALLSASMGTGPVPEITEEYRVRIFSWVRALRKD